MGIQASRWNSSDDGGFRLRCFVAPAGGHLFYALFMDENENGIALFTFSMKCYRITIT
jgi:hypothetical protein